MSDHDTDSQTLAHLRDQLNIHRAVQPTYGGDTTVFATTFVQSELRVLAEPSRIQDEAPSTAMNIPDAMHTAGTLASHLLS